MKKLLLTAFVFSHLLSLGQIKMGQIDEPIEPLKNELIEPVPTYDSIQNFVSYWSYCNGYESDPYRFKHKEDVKPCDINDFYRRYEGLQIYYPDFKNNYKINEIRLFQYSNFDTLTWDKVGNKTYKIIDIKAGTNNFPQFKSLKEKYPNIYINDENEKWNNSLIFILKDIHSNDTLCVFDNDVTNQKFILVPYYNSIRKKYLNKDLVPKNYIACLVKPKEYERAYWAEEGSNIKCVDISIVHNGDLYNDCKKFSIDEQDVTIAYKLKQDSVIYYLDDKYERRYSNYSGNRTFMPNIMYYFELRNIHEKQLSENINNELKEENIRRNNLISNFGKEYGTLIFQGKVKIGMSKKMCEESWGITNSKQKITDNSGVSEVWRYNKGTLVFKNGILTKIVN